MPKQKQLIEIYPFLPQSIGRLAELAGNLFFSWHRSARALFEDLDPELWKQVNGNPRLMLRCVSQQSVDRAASDEAYLGHYREVLSSFDAYLSAPRRADEPMIAYFCAEYGFHESFPIYSGGLGILAGDHCKAASDEQLNFVAVGLLYTQGYFSQSVDNDGLQHANYAENDPRDLPVEAVRDADGRWLQVSVRIAGRDVVARIWKALVGRVSVYLLDTNCQQNAPEDREITHRLYGGDASVRIRQEMMLGLGGVRALRAVGLAPQVWHMNEGHAAFLILELVRECVARDGLEFAAALEAVATQCVFTTHTPVSAGHDAFDIGLFLHCFQDLLPDMRVPPARVLELGQAPQAAQAFNMTHLALNGARGINGVSRIHGAVSSRLCADHWPEVPAGENPLGYVTNGVHVPTFLAQTWGHFFDEKLGAQWHTRMSDVHFWRPLEQVPDGEFWQTAQQVKIHMLTNVRERLAREYAAKGLSPMQLRHITRLLDPDRPNVLTLGFARRFATYKRASLLLRDRARLARLVKSEERPVLILFAGKAHPADHPGQQVLREIKLLTLTPEFAGHVVFLENYDLQLARWLVMGVDVWLNTPVAPLEASGTSGIKAAINGRLNVSILDGWWAEGFGQDNGWGIPASEVQDAERRDALDAGAMLDTIEEEVVPLYYQRNGRSYSAKWVQRCKRAMMTVIPHFNMGRVVQDYACGLYYPAVLQHQRLLQGGIGAVEAFAAWKQRVRERWPGVALRGLSEPPRELPRAGSLTVRVAATLNGLTSADVRVEFVAQRMLPRSRVEMPPLSSYRQNRPDDAWRALLHPTDEPDGDGASVYQLDALPQDCGQFAFEIRIYPWHELLTQPFELGLMKRL
ncbi:MAG TPA: alpha-glucan family phosphorylase [Steroidobacteraceae bacterium]|jgi:starch phosphorylase|nr:alpha-glucan family phosphorylase [Steroidobacteraceae bacterium]